jgi:hypothetical protein
MWGTSSPDDKLTGDLGSVIETTQIGGRRSDRLMAGKLSPGNFGLLQQYRHKADMLDAWVDVRFRGILLQKYFDHLSAKHWFKIERDQETLIQKRTRPDSIVLISNSTASARRLLQHNRG